MIGLKRKQVAFALWLNVGISVSSFLQALMTFAITTGQKNTFITEAKMHKKIQTWAAG